ncbi:hypothetical protein PPERSA_00582 [Pseudocohnilembus persalinus]|uniref:Uncharacterized protein n=1 Tax=Pseudocohnilembus persalinus TaxID=266149 RepID=A0A0V0QSV5_PSEPJ|nr:hypothetical protein PPERSA_00582 [Pseudocohnilembus persalinus]|eukprot:KRX05281.1 hypothetical protein PPERSA_00582 [Pseudocohnilembus persalinus]
MAPLCQCTMGFYYDKQINDCIECDKDCNDSQKAKQQEIKDQEILEQSKNKTVKNQGILKQKTQFEPLAIQINQNNKKVTQISSSCKKQSDKILNPEQQTHNLNKNSQKSKLNQKQQLQPIVLNRKFKNSSQYSSYSISTQEDINQFNQNIKNKSTSVKFNLNENEYFNVPLQSK